MQQLELNGTVIYYHNNTMQYNKSAMHENN